MFVPPPLPDRQIDTIWLHDSLYAKDHFGEGRDFIVAFEYLRRIWSHLSEQDRDYYMWCKNCHNRKRLMTGPTEQLLKFLVRKYLPGMPIWANVNPVPERWQSYYKKNDFGPDVYSSL
jgi:hypothetical protein